MKRAALFFTISMMSLSFSAVYAQSDISSANGISVTSGEATYKAVQWYRDSAERNASYREIFRMSENKIKKEVKKAHLQPQQWGIIVDIDETTLDNSEWNYHAINAVSPQDWNTFAAEEKSLGLPGVKAFLAHIHAEGGFVNLVSNRPATLQAATENNLKKQGIYFDQVLLDTTNKGTSMVDKNPRFDGIEKGLAPSHLKAQKIIAWFGDNIQDFPHLYQHNIIKEDPNGSAYKEFGKHFFMLPNPMYGSWEANPLK